MKVFGIIVTIILVIAFFICYACCYFDNFEMRQTSFLTLSDAIVQVIDSAYVKTTKVMDITLASSYDGFDWHFRAILNQALSKLNDRIAYRILDFDYLQKSDLRGFNLILVDGYESFELVYEILSDDLFDYRGYYLIIISEYDSDHSRTLQRIFSKLYDKFVLNVNILLGRNSSMETIGFHTYFPFSEEGCPSFEPKMYHSFHNGNLFGLFSHFPNKVKNFNQCPFNFITFAYVPYMMVTRFDDGSIELDGTDAFILKTLEEKLNFSTNVVILKNEIFPWGVVFPNGSATGAIETIIHGNNSFTAAGYILTYELSTASMSSSVTYTTIAMVMALPSPKPYTSIEVLLLPFQNITWSLIAFMFSVGSVTITILKLIGHKYRDFITGYGNRSPTLRMFNIWLGGSTHVLPKRNFARTLLLIAILSTLVLRIAYQGSLLKYLQGNKAKPSPSSIEEIVKTGHSIFYTADMEDIVTQMGFTEDRREIMPGTDDTMYYERLYDPSCKAVVFDSLVQIKLYNSRNLSKRPISMLPDQIMGYPVIMFFKKFSFLKKPFDEILMSMISGGLIEHHLSQYLNRTDKSTRNLEKSVDLHKLKIGDFEGCMKIYGIMMVMSIGLLVAEVLSTKFQFIKKIIDFHTS